MIDRLVARLQSAADTDSVALQAQSLLALAQHNFNHSYLNVNSLTNVKYSFLYCIDINSFFEIISMKFAYVFCEIERSR